MATAWVIALMSQSKARLECARLEWATDLLIGREAARRGPALAHVVQPEVEHDRRREHGHERELLQLEVEDRGVGPAGGADAEPRCCIADLRARCHKFGALSK
jgi:hypothetical protein